MELLAQPAPEGFDRPAPGCDRPMSPTPDSVVAPPTSIVSLLTKESVDQNIHLEKLISEFRCNLDRLIGCAKTQPEPGEEGKVCIPPSLVEELNRTMDDRNSLLADLRTEIDRLKKF